MATGVFTIQWRILPSAAIFFPTSDTFSIANNTTVAVTSLTIARYNNNPAFVGITVTNTQAGYVICFDERQVGNKVLIYPNFGANYYEFEVQIWAAGCWTLVNPGSGSARPNQIFLGTPVPFSNDFPANERPLDCGNLPPPPGCFPPVPPYNPFTPWLVVTLDQIVGECTLSDKMRVTLNPIPTVNIIRAAVYKDSVNTGVTLTQLLAGYTFTAPGDYRVEVVYRYLGDAINPPSTVDETLTRNFSISTTPFPHIQMQSLVYDFIEPGQAILFNSTLVSEGTIEYSVITREFTLRFCGDYFIKWFIAAQSGLTTNGANFAIAVNGQTDLIGSSHVRVSPTLGFSIVRVSGAPPTISLVNISDDTVYLSPAVKVTAGIVIFKIGDEMPASMKA